jgi:hypothetical protein
MLLAGHVVDGCRSSATAVPGAGRPPNDVLYVTSPAVATRLALSYARSRPISTGCVRSSTTVASRLVGEGRPGLPAALPAARSHHVARPGVLDRLPVRRALPFGAGRQAERAGRTSPCGCSRRGWPPTRTRWEHPYDIGFVHYHLGDYRAAADWFRRAADVPGAASWLGPLAAVTLAAGGDVESRASCGTDARVGTDEAGFAAWPSTACCNSMPSTRSRQLEAPRPPTNGAGHSPANWDDLVQESGLLRGVPHDPAGHPYVLDRSGRTVTLSRESPLWPLPADTPF